MLQIGVLCFEITKKNQKQRKIILEIMGFLEITFMFHLKTQFTLTNPAFF
jgi:hypothetical protein